MAAHCEPETLEAKECANCSSEESLMLCSRCRSAWFCSLKCQKSYWPFHRAWCRSNEFADALEATEPRFARWMRKHHKIAVLKDDEVDRLERKVATVEDMYGRANPKPIPPSYDADDMRAMRAAEERAALEARAGATERLWTSLVVPELLGLDLDLYKWRQNQSYVEVFVQLPPGAEPRTVRVELATQSLAVYIGEERVFEGQLFAPVKAEESVWLITDGVLEIQLLKRNRRGQYSNGCTNSDTFWFSLLANRNGRERLALERPPDAYYRTDWEHIGCADAHKLRGRRGGGGRAPSARAIAA